MKKKPSIVTIVTAAVLSLALLGGVIFLGVELVMELGDRSPADTITIKQAEDLINEQRDLIYFVEKDFETATSSCKRADKYGLHKNQSLYNAYKIGKLGAKPALGSPFILNE